SRVASNEKLQPLEAQSTAAVLPNIQGYGPQQWQGVRRDLRRNVGLQPTERHEKPSAFVIKQPDVKKIARRQTARASRGQPRQHNVPLPRIGSSILQGHGRGTYSLRQTRD